MTRDRELWFIVPDGLDDPERVTGGNVYDRHVRDGLQNAGWNLRVCAASDPATTEAALAAIPPGSIALVDGLVAGWAPAAAVRAAQRLPVVIIAHMPVDDRALGAAAHVIATSEWTANGVRGQGRVRSALVTVAVPGAEPGATPSGDPDYRHLLCVGVVSAHKGQDILLRALDLLSDDDWSCTLAGSRTTDPDFAAEISAAASHFDGRVRMPGVLDRPELAAAYASAGLLVAPSRTESYGMAIIEARQWAIPVIASDTGGIPEAVAGGGALLVKSDDPHALSQALERWMSEPALRDTLRAETTRDRSLVPTWADTIALIDAALESV
ncbi:MAG: glycosyltransferase [Microbacteriaceae bacterium]|nr:glycosyltransferase [Microbacteriaceae bacterium]